MNKVICNLCGGEMHRMTDHMADRYECEKCKHAVAPEYVIADSALQLSSRLNAAESEIEKLQAELVTRNAALIVAQVQRDAALSELAAARIAIANQQLTRA